MRYNYRYRLNPTDELHERLTWTVDTCRQVYNHFLHRLNREDGTSAYSEQSVLPDLKDWWNELKQVHSKVLQKVVQRLYDNLSTLKGRKDNGYRVGELKWKAPQEYRSIKYSQTGFELNNTSGRTVLSLSKIGDIPMVYHRDVPDDATIKEVVVKQEPTGEWFAVLGIETEDDAPPKPKKLEDCVGTNSHNRAGAAWGTFLRMLEYKCEREGTHFVAVDPAGTTKECAACGVSTDKPLWVREHSCPSCGFTADRDWNAAYNILVRGLKQVGTGCPESTPAETALPTGTDSVPAKRVVETGNPTLKERTASAVSE